VLWQNSRDFNLINTQGNGNISLRTVVSLVSGAPVEVLKITGNTGLAEVRGNPISANGVATKSYVDNLQGVALGAITANVTALINGASASRRDFGNIETVLDTYSGNFTTVNNVLDTKANIDGQTFTGVPKADTAPAGTSNTQIATTAFVTGAINTSTTAWQANASTQSAELALRANISSPDFSGTPQTTHVADNDRSRRIATTSFVGNMIDTATNGIDNGLSSKAPVNNPSFTGYPVSAFTPANLTYGALSTTSAPLGIVVSHPYPTQLATVGFVANIVATMPSANLTPYATKVSPALEGVPTAPTPNVGDNSTKIATTKFVAERSPVLSVNTQTGDVVLAVGDVAGAAPIANPTFTGVASSVSDPAPWTPGSAGSLQLATTRWVGNIAANLAPKSEPTFIGTVTVPNPADNSNANVAATTAWVRGRIAVADVPYWDGSGKFISTAAPISSDGNNGDIWFQYTP
jgi:hypothetical protein